MGHGETPVQTFRTTNLVLTPADIRVSIPTAGTLKLSGSKVWFSNGTNFEVVTSG